jgi:uncharacterized UBP type Zn finger protein
VSATPCGHLGLIRPVRATTPGCAECLRLGAAWAHLRICLVCGHVGCCDSSPGRHARRHFHVTGHPVMASIEPGEHWGWCYVDEVEFEVPPQLISGAPPIVEKQGERYESR